MTVLTFGLAMGANAAVFRCAPSTRDGAAALGLLGPGMMGLRDQYRQPLRVLMAMVALVLLIACGNIAMLLAARNSARLREFSLRTALGGSTSRLLRQLLIESALLVTAGTVLGWFIGLGATRALAVLSISRSRSHPT